MSTLPRTRSLGGADARSLTLNNRHERHRPASLCESSLHKVDPTAGGEQNRLRRTPSQANNLSTTVPTSLVTRTLGGRHTPTKSSLRHSRMAVMSRNSKAVQRRRWINTRGVGRVASLVITAQVLVGVVGVVLALWLLQWAPFLPFREVPHYAGALVLLSGILAVILKSCQPKLNRCITVYIKIFLASILLGSIVSCSCVCVFSALHLVNLAPMECTLRTEVVVHSASPLEGVEEDAVTLSPSEIDFRTPSEGVSKALDRFQESRDFEGSGSTPFDQYNDDETDSDYYTDRQIETVTLSAIETMISKDIIVNISNCICELRTKGWRFVMNYPNLSCNDVKNILPIIFVASCVVTGVGGVLSALLLYIFSVSRWTLDRSYGRTSTAEKKPFILKTKFKNFPDRDHNGSIKNGSYKKR